MKRVLVIAMLGLLGFCCREKENNPVQPTPEPEPELDTGITRTFTINVICGDENYKATQSNADRQCIALGYEYAKKLTYKNSCMLNGRPVQGLWLDEVTCWKP